MNNPLSDEIKVMVDGRPYRAAKAANGGEFLLQLVRPLEIVTGSVLTDETGATYRVEQCHETAEGNARLRVTSMEGRK